MLNIRWSEPTRHLPPRWLSIISYHQALVEHLFLLYLILFYFETYVSRFPDEYVEETSLQILLLQKKRHIFRELNSMSKGNYLHNKVFFFASLLFFMRIAVSIVIVISTCVVFLRVKWNLARSFGKTYCARKCKKKNGYRQVISEAL